MTTRRDPFGRLPLFWKILLPFLVLILILGATGAFLVVRDLASNARSRLEQDLGRLSLNALSLAHDRELYLLESATFASNVQGMHSALHSGDATTVAGLLGSVLTLKKDLDMLVAADASGVGVVEYVPRTGATTPTKSSGHRWIADKFVYDALADPSGGRHSGFLIGSSDPLLAIASPVCASKPPCRSSGVAIAAVRVQRFAEAASGIHQLSPPRRNRSRP